MNLRVDDELLNEEQRNRILNKKHNSMASSVSAIS